MKVGQIINILPSQSNHILWKCLTDKNQKMETKESGKSFRDGPYIYIYIIFFWLLLQVCHLKIYFKWIQER